MERVCLDLSDFESRDEGGLARLAKTLDQLSRRGASVTWAGGSPELARLARTIWTECLLRSAERLDPELFSPR